MNETIWKVGWIYWPFVYFIASLRKSCTNWFNTCKSRSIDWLNQFKGQDEGNIPVSVRDQVYQENSGLLFLVISRKCWCNQIQSITPLGARVSVSSGPVPTSRGLLAKLSRLMGHEEGNIPVFIVCDQFSKEKSDLLFWVISQQCWFNQIQLIPPFGLRLGGSVRVCTHWSSTCKSKIHRNESVEGAGWRKQSR